MKFGILTFHRANNYGAVLQCFALQYFLQSNGHEAFVIDYVNKKLTQAYQNFYIGKPNLKSLLSAVYNYNLKASRNKTFRAFRDKYIQLGNERGLSRKELSQLNHVYDCFVVGSDQVWNPSLTDWDESYFLDFADACKKLSYAASLGNYTDNEETRAFYKRNIDSFKRVSVRENSSKEYLQSLTNKEIVCHIDPVFLCPVQEWEKIAGSRIIKEKYIFVYCLHEENTYKAAEALAERTGLQIVSIPNSKRAKVKGKKRIGASVEEFLNYIRFAEFVITDSFHATAFSVVFQKKFQAVLKKNLTGLNPRLENLLNLLRLGERIYSENSSIEQEVDYSAAMNAIQAQIEKSRTYFTELE